MKKVSFSRFGALGLISALAVSACGALKSNAPDGSSSANSGALSGNSQSGGQTESPPSPPASSSLADGNSCVNQNPNTVLGSTTQPTGGTGAQNPNSTHQPSWPTVQAPNEPSLGAFSTAHPLATYTSLTNAELFSASGPQLDDVLQTEVGDCTTLSALAAIAEQNPNLLLNAIKQIGVTNLGTAVYQVTLFPYPRNSLPTSQSVAAQTVIVDASFAKDSQGFIVDKFVSDTSSGDVIIWPAVFLKAIAALYGNTYDNVTLVQIAAITGVPSGLVTTKSPTSEPAPIAATLGMLSEGYAMTALTLSAYSIQNVSNPNNVATVGQFGCIQDQADNFCTVYDHSYTVVSFDGNGVLVRNPWGNNIGDGVSDGTAEVTMPLRDFSLLFTGLIYNKTK